MAPVVARATQTQHPTHAFAQSPNMQLSTAESLSRGLRGDYIAHIIAR